MSPRFRYLAWALIAPTCLSAQSAHRTAQTTRVGPAMGTLIVVGGGSMGPEIYEAFIRAAGGPDALIIDVPTAGGATEYPTDGGQAWRRAGARNVRVFHTRDRRLADSDSFTAIIKQAGGVWFGGGRQFHLMDAYAGTKTEQAFREVLERGGVVGGSSAGATILGSFLVRGAPSSNNTIMYYPGYEKGFGYLREVGVDQHVVARERLPDLADSIMPRFPNLLGISEDEGTAWIVKGDTGTIIGRSKAFVYGGQDANDPNRPFLTLFPGDKYNLSTRRVLSRALDASSLRHTFIDSLFGQYRDTVLGGATVLVAQNGNVLIAKSFGVPDQPRYTPTTSAPQFALRALGEIFPAICSQLPAQPARGNNPPDSAAGAGRAGRGGRGGNQNQTPLQNCVSSRVASAVGMQRTTATAEGQVMSSVDALYRLALGLEAGSFARDTTVAFDPAKGWTADSYRGLTRLSAFGTAAGQRHAFVRIPERRATVIVLTNDESADAKGLAERITERLLFGRAQ
jgi:cyanophycinase